MAFDTHLADRVRELLAVQPGVDERRMFGALAFLVAGNMAVAVRRDGGLMVRVPHLDVEKLTQRDHVTPMTMGDREMRGWVHVADPGLRTRRQLKTWVDRGVTFAKSLPPK